MRLVELTTYASIGRKEFSMPSSRGAPKRRPQYADCGQVIESVGYPFTKSTESSNRKRDMMNKAIAPELILGFASLRTLVATLGESATPPWWRTQFLSELSLRAMIKVFPRTVILAGISSVTVAARTDHDRRVGLGRRFHLFRLPTPLEQALSEFISADAYYSEVTTLLKKPRPDLLNRIRELTNGCTVKFVDGPIDLGMEGRLFEAATIGEMAAYYRASFESGHRAFPYLEREEQV